MTLIHRLLCVSVMIVCGAVSHPVVAAEAEVLCPDVEAAKKSAPGDIGGVQADIERLNLCVERAKLLQQLDSVVQQRQAILKKITQPTDMMPTGTVTSGIGTFPPLPIGALPPLQGDPVPANLKPGEVRITNAVGNAFDTAAKPVATWQIRKIWGQGGGMRAQLADGNTILNVVKGDPLPDGGTVETISVKGVAVSRNGNINDLSWEQLTDTAASSNAKIIP